MNYKTLLNWSGGLDSTYCLLDYLKTNSGEELVVNHLILMNNENRWREELNSVRKTIEWLTNKDMFKFHYIETRYKQPDYLQSSFDVHIVDGYIAGGIANTYPSISEIIIPTNYADANRGNGNAERVALATFIRDSVCGRTLQVVKPVAHMKKQEIIEGIPKEVLKNIWYCRNPIHPFIPCGKCHGCTDVIA